jgi:hypothetical protein
MNVAMSMIALHAFTNADAGDSREMIQVIPAKITVGINHLAMLPSRFWRRSPT